MEESLHLDTLICRHAEVPILFLSPVRYKHSGSHVQMREPWESL